jgi:DNA-binding MarR family transcriptional regulator
MPKHPAQSSRAAAPTPQTAGGAAPPWHVIPTAAARRFHQICVAKSSEVFSEFGLTPLQFGAMVYLNRQTGSPGIEQNTLATRLNIDRNTASVIVEQLVKSDVVVRQVNGADRRARLLSLSAKGERVYAESLPGFRATNAAVLTPLAPKERKLFMDLLVRVIEGNLRCQSHAQPPSLRSRRRSSANKA